MRLAPFALLSLLFACTDKADDEDPAGDDGDDGFGWDDGGDEGGDDGSVDNDADDDGYDADEDCDDNNPDVHPFADEYCDDVDNDCDGQVDEDSSLDATTWYLDEDFDGYGTNDERDTACVAPSGYVAQGGDCDDDDPNFNPGAAEEDCTDPNDYNCDGEVAFADEDEDGFAACEDCDDEDPALNPDAVEICDDVDNDCDGLVDDDDGDVDKTTRKAFYPDADTDGYGDSDAVSTLACSQPTGFVQDNTDCDDGATDVHPGASEVCDAANTDEDCNGKADDADSGVAGSTLSEFWLDADKDGYGAGSSSLLCDDPSTASVTWVQVDGDCDDNATGVNPAAAEICDAADTDEDCDGNADDDDSSVSSAGKKSWYTDSDKDGYGSDTATAVKYCDDPSTSSSKYSSSNTDCDDSDTDVNPGEVEICDSADVDEDCNGYADDDDPDLDGTGATAWYTDDDGDSYGADSSETFACDDPSTSSTTYITTGGDCDDDNEFVNPGETEVCDLLDNDCDASTTASGEVTYINSSGTSSTVTSTFSGGTAASPTSAILGNGTYYFCDDTFYVSLTASYDVDLVGVNGSELNGGGSKRVLNISNAAVSLTDLIVSDGYLSGTSGNYGGAIYCSGASGELTLDGVDVTDSYAYNGGAVYLNTCDATVTDTVFDGNQASNIGAALYLYGNGTVDIEDSSFINGYAPGGGAFGQYSGTINITDTVVEDNASTYGGGLYASSYGTFNCTRSGGADGGFYGNTATSSSFGGAVYASSMYSFTLTSTSCNWGTGSDDNTSYEIVIDPRTGSTVYYNKGNNQTFSCSTSGC